MRWRRRTAILAALYAHRGALARTRSSTPGIVSPTLNVGLIKGGINTNVVPDQVDVPDRPAHDPGGEAGQGRGRAARADRGAAPHHPQTKVDVRRLLLAEPLVPQPGSGAARGRDRSATPRRFWASTCR